jgi:hypothetical protein
MRTITSQGLESVHKYPIAVCLSRCLAVVVGTSNGVAAGGRTQPFSKKANASCEHYGVTSLAFPDHKCLPPKLANVGFVSLVASRVTSKLAKPVFAVPRWDLRDVATRMTMPKAPVYEDDDAMFWQNDVWRAG